MQLIAQRLNATILEYALGESDGNLEIDVPPDDIGASSFFREIGPLNETERYSVAVHRFDTVVDAFDRPTLCKIDVQGSEMMVLRGMGARIREIDVFVIETSTIATMKGAPEVADVTFLQEQGFVPYDVLSLKRRPLDSALAQVDLLFVKYDRRFVRTGAGAVNARGLPAGLVTAGLQTVWLSRSHAQPERHECQVALCVLVGTAFPEATANPLLPRAMRRHKRRCNVISQKSR